MSLKDRYKNSRFSGVVSVVLIALKDFFRAILPLFVFYAVSLPVLFLLNYFFGSGVDSGMYVILQGISSAAVLPFFHVMYRKDRLQREARPNFTVKEKLLRYGYAALTVGVLSVAVNNLLGILRIDQISLGWEQAREAFYGGSPAVELLFLGIVVPYVEEFLYRGLIFERFRDLYTLKKSILLSAILFGVFHFNLAQFVYALIMGIFLANYAERYHSFFPAFMGHAAANCIAILRQEIHFGLDESLLLTLVLTILFAAGGIVLFGFQYKIKALK